MGWWPWTDTTTIEQEISATYSMVQAIYIKSTGDQNMSKLHDRLSTLVGDLEQNSETVIANATENETGFQDIITRMEAVIEKLKKKIADDASGGSSTGGGSGAQ